MQHEKIKSFLIRTVTNEDLDALYDLAKQTGPGMTSLPADKKLLADKIQESINSLKIEPTKVGAEAYRFVLEYEQKIIGVAAIRARVGGYEPSYSYEIKTNRKVSPALGVDKEVEFLEVCKEHDGPTIVSSLFISPEFRAMGYGRYLSLARFLFMANFPQRFTDTVIAEMRGYINDANQSPFWEGTIRHFFDMDFDKADYLSAKDKGFIAELMPKFPIYISLLPEPVRESIGKVHRDTAFALRYLEQQGFKRDGHVDIFDAGPRVACKVNNIKAVKESLIKKVKAGEAQSKSILIANMKTHFRVTQTMAEIAGDNIIIPQYVISLLDVEEGDSVRFIEL